MHIRTILSQVKNQQGNAIVGNSERQLRIALLAIYGADDRSSVEEALSIIELLSIEKYPAALFELGLLYWKGLVVAQNHRLAFQLICQAVEMNFAPAMSSLGALYFSGIGCDKNFDKAIYWYEQSEKQQLNFYHERMDSVALNKSEFRRRFDISINDIHRAIPRILLERLNQWRLSNVLFGLFYFFKPAFVVFYDI
ncbi:MAG: tetratricopeptide repeat protein [Betaproteobacteria bacterium]